MDTGGLAVVVVGFVVVVVEDVRVVVDDVLLGLLVVVVLLVLLVVEVMPVLVALILVDAPTVLVSVVVVDNGCAQQNVSTSGSTMLMFCAIALPLVWFCSSGFGSGIGHVELLQQLHVIGLKRAPLVQWCVLQPAGSEPTKSAHTPVWPVFPTC